MRQISLILILLLTVSVTNVCSAHDIHISYAQAELKGNTLSVKVSYYKDDFSKAVKSWYQGRADHFSDEQFKDAEFEYVKNYFRVATNGDNKGIVAPKLMSRTDDGSTVVMQLEYTCANPSQITIDHRVLFKEYSDQMNIFFIKAFGKEENHIFTPSKPTIQIKP
ncbi:MAG: DUF6702 family protein [bacterium]